MKPLTDEELLSIISAYRNDSLGIDDGELTNQRSDALDHYHGRPYGDEKDGRSSVVSKDLSETVEWILPAIMKVFISSGNIAEFLPEGQEDEELARQESDYVNLVIMKDNDGFLVLHDGVKDALILKNGYFKHYWYEDEEIKEYEYEGLEELELAQLIMSLEQQGEVKIKEQKVEEVETEFGILSSYDVKIQVIETKGRCIIEAVPVEEVRISKRCRGSLQDSPFTVHGTRKTRSDLIQMGMPHDFVYSLPSLNDVDDQFNLKHSRDTTADESDEYIGVSFDRSMDEIEFCEAYLKVDYDGDGIAELRKVVTVGNKIPPGEEWNEQIDAVPLTGMVPKRVPHRHVGESLDDELDDLQRIKTILTRQMLDNVYLTNNQELVINERANIPDFLRRLPGGLKRIRGEDPVGNAVMPVPTTPILNQILPAIDYIDSVKANRTGIDKSTTGVDPDIVKQSTKGAFLENLNRASQKVEMIIRMLAETGVKELVRQVHAILQKHQDKQRVVKLRGKYVPVNPQEWRERNNLTVSVGIGTGTQEEKREKYMILNQLQTELLQFGGADPLHKINLFSDIAKGMDFDNPEKYAYSPEQFQQVMQQRAMSQQNQPNQLAEAEMVKGQAQKEITIIREQAKAQIEQVKLQYNQQLEAYKKDKDHEHKMHQLQADMVKQVRQILSDEAKAVLDAEVKLWVEGQKTDIAKPGIGAGLQDEV